MIVVLLINKFFEIDKFLKFTFTTYPPGLTFKTILSFSNSFWFNPQYFKIFIFGRSVCMCVNMYVCIYSSEVFWMRALSFGYKNDQADFTDLMSFLLSNLN